MAKKTIARSGNKFGPAARKRELAGLAKVLKGPLTIKRFHEWASAAVGIRESILQDRVFGTIRWKKSIGRSLGPTLASGFRAEHWYHELNWRVTAGGIPEDIGKWVQGPEPDLWDMPDDGGLFQVGYAFWAVRPWTNAVILRFRETQPWDSPLKARARRTFRSIVPQEQDFWMGDAKFAVLAETTIVEVPIRYFG